MDVHLPVRRRAGKIERRIARLSERAQRLFERERQVQEHIAHSGRPRAINRAERRRERLRSRRTQLVEGELRAIMLSLQQESSRTRERLDRELERMAPLQREWERLRGMFDSLEEAIATPALDELTGQWQGGLKIPDFPVTEQTGYIKPFPPKAILF